MPPLPPRFPVGAAAAAAAGSSAPPPPSVFSVDSLPAVSAGAGSNIALFILRFKVEALGLGASGGAVLALDLLVVVDERGEQFLAEYSRLLLLQHLQYHDLIADSEYKCVARVGMTQ